MPNYLLSPSEGDLAKAFGSDAITSPLPEQKGADVLSYTKQGLLGVQRKRAPHDFILSVTDGRLNRETTMLSKECKIPLLLIENRLRYWPDGHLHLGTRVPSGFTRKQIKGILWDAKYIKGVDYDFTDSLEDTVAYVRGLTDYMNGGKHLGPFNRPSAKGTWYVPTAKDIHIWLLQSFPGIGPATADRIVQQFGGVPMRWTCTFEELCRVPMLSRNKAKEIYAALNELPLEAIVSVSKPASAVLDELRQKLRRP